MRALPVAGLLALCAACAAPAPPPPAPVPPAPPPEQPGIETSAMETATLAAVPLAPQVAVAPQARDLPGKLSPGQVEKTFKHYRRFFDGAYRERLHARPGLKGRIVVSFVIQPDGTTRGARKVDSSLGDPAFERAVLDQIDRMSFPPAAGMTPVERYPLQFSERLK